MQIAERFHLLKNLLDGFEKFLYRQHAEIEAATRVVFSSQGRAISNVSAERTSTPSAAQALLNAALAT